MLQSRLAHFVQVLVAAAFMLVPWTSSATAQGLAVAADTSTVHVGSGGFAFSPDPQTVAVGDTVHWVWDGFSHSTTSGSCAASTCTPDGRWDSGVHDSGFTFDFTFTTTGTYSYYCTIHGPLFDMRGTIIVIPELPIAGLSAASSSPTPLNSATLFTATVSSGSHIAYTWDFGDGQLGGGITATHTYAAFGHYTAVVSATNTISTVVASTPVTVLRNLYLPLVQR